MVATGSSKMQGRPRQRKGSVIPHIEGLRRQLADICFLPLHHKLPIGVARTGVYMGDVGAGGEVVDVNGNCTLTNEIFQNSRRLNRGTAKYCFVHFLHLATFFPKTTTFQTKNVTFIILIFSELNIIDT